MAGDSPYGSGQPPFLYSNFTAGLNTLDAPYLLDPNASVLFARDVLNVQGTTAGAITKRTGLQTLASPSNVFTSLIPSEATTTPFLIGTDSSQIYSVTNGGTVTSLKTGLSNNRWEGVSATAVSSQGPVFMMNGVDTPQQWNGVAASTTAWTNATGAVGVPNGKYMATFQNQIFVAGTSSTPSGMTAAPDPKSRVYWCSIANPTEWDPAQLKGAGFMDFDPNDGGAITGIGVVGPYVVVAKPRKLWVITSVAGSLSRMVSTNVGIASHRSIDQGPEGMFFLAEDRGVYLFNGSKLTPLSDKIRPTLDSITGTLRSQAAGQYFNAHYYLSISLGGSVNDTTLDYDLTLNSWWKHSIGANDLVAWHPTGAASVANLYSAATDAAKVDQCFTPGVYTDRGAAMSWLWTSPWQSPTFYRRRQFPTPYFRKRLRQIRFDGFGTVDYSLSKDFAGSPSLIQANSLPATSGNFGASDGSLFGGAGTFGDVPVRRARFYSLGVADAFSQTFSATSSTADAIYEYVLLMIDRKDSLS